MGFLGLCLTPPALFTGPGKGLAVAVVDTHEMVPPIVVVPVKGGLDGGSRHPGPTQEVQGHPHSRALHRHIPRLAAGIPQRKICKDVAGNAAFLDNVPRTAEHHRGDSVALQVPRDQTHGLVTNGSEAGEQHGIHTVLPAPCEDLGGVALNRVALAVIGGYAVEAGRQRPDAACGGHLTHTVQR